MTSPQYAVRYTTYALVPAAVPAWAVAAVVVAARVAVRIGCVSRTRDDNCAVAVTVAVAWVVVGEIAACEGDCDYCKYDCRY